MHKPKGHLDAHAREACDAARDHMVAVAGAAGAYFFEIRKSPDDTSTATLYGSGMSTLYAGVDGGDADETHRLLLAAMHPDDRAGLLHEYSYDTLRAGIGDSHEIEYRLLVPDGSVRWVRCRWVTQMDGEDAVIEGLAQDVTSQHDLMTSAQAARIEAEDAAALARNGRDDVEQLLAEASSLAAQLEEAGLQADARSEELRRSEVQLRAERDFNAALISASSEYAIISTDRDGVVKVFNTGAEALFGRTAESVVGRVSLHELHDPEELRSRAESAGVEPGFAALVHLARADMPDRHNWTCVRGDGSHVPVQATIAPIPSPDGTSIGYLAVAYDITARLREERKRERHAEQLEHAASTDGLTGLVNRRRASDLIERALADDTKRHSLGLVMLDVDHFKRVNDTYGHEAGDRVLRAVANRLSMAARAGDLIARWGGEEFALLLHEVSDPATLHVVAERLRRKIGDTPIALADGSQLRVTASAGGALVRHGATLESLCAEADRGLYAAKRCGRDRLLVADDAISHVHEGDVETVQLAQAFALATSLREGVPDIHCQQVAELSAAIAVDLDLPLEIVHRCRLGGWLHDLGKLAVPDGILSKRGPLDDSEWAQIHAHPAIGDMLASRIPALEAARPAIRHHHERIDGSGYPDGLAGEDIPIEARIVACADAYSALTGDRPYRREIGYTESLAQLRLGAGTHLDPMVVEALVRVCARPHAGLDLLRDNAA